MTSANGSGRLGRMEALLSETINGLVETRQIAESNSRAIQAMLEQRATDRLEHEQRMRREEARIKRQDELIERLSIVQERIAKMNASLDEDRPNYIEEVKHNRK